MHPGGGLFASRRTLCASVAGPRPPMPTDPARYFAPFVYLIPAAIALSIAWVLRGKAHQPPARTHYTRVLFWLCLAQGLHNAYYFVATLLRIYDSAAYAWMMLPLP